MSTGRAFLPAIGLGAVLCWTAISAHHALNAAFDERDRITLKGTIMKIEWVNPHAWIHIDVTSPNGPTAHWAVETAPPAVLLARGVRKDDFRIGAEVVIDGYRAKNRTTASGRIVRLPDGTELFLR
jgi:hypothetical protein